MDAVGDLAGEGHGGGSFDASIRRSGETGNCARTFPRAVRPDMAGAPGLIHAVAVRARDQFLNQEQFMAKIVRTEPGAILSKAVEYHGFVYLPGITARDTSKDIKGQTADVLAQIDAMLERHGTDKTRLLQAIIWVKHIKDRAALNEVWTPWIPAEGPPARACVQAEMAAPEVLVEIMVTACK
jgi:enamine deaminase RidA (YjgF/YER057c/UK114 family)